MVTLTIDEIAKMQQNKQNIRNISVIAHVDHGKSTLTDQLIQHNGISAQSRFMDSRKDEAARGITIKSASVALYYEIKQKYIESVMDQSMFNGTKFLINLIDSPGHVDFSSEVTAALRVTDGAIVVVDCVDGICVQTETVLRQAVEERIKPSLVLNKLDRAFLELNFESLDLENQLCHTIDISNQKLDEFCNSDSKFKVDKFDPVTGNVSFFSGLQGWGFTLRTFADFYLEKYKQTNVPDGNLKIRRMLWSKTVHFSSQDPWDENGKVIKSFKSGSSMFVTHVLNPISKVKKYCMTESTETDNKKLMIEYLANYKVKFEADEITELNGKTLFKYVMKKWLAGAPTLFEQIVTTLPSPVESQVYRSESLYTGDINDKFCTAIRNCDTSENAPLMMYVSKMIPQNDGRFIAFGRVLSGSLTTGQRVHIQGPDFVPGSNNDYAVKNIQRIILMMGRNNFDIPYCPAGNIVGLVGIDQVLKKTGTISSEAGASNIKTMKFSVSPVVKYAVRPTNSVDLLKFKEGLIRLAKSDPLCLVETTESGEMSVAGAGELHLEICINDLKDYANCGVTFGEPMINYLESVSNVVECKMSKSANKHNRITMSIEPIEGEMLINLENGSLVNKDPKERSQKFQEVLGIKEDWVKKIMFYAPLDKGSNIMVDDTKGVAHLHEIKDHMKAAMELVAKSGPLIGEPLRGVRFNLDDCVLHADAIHRTSPQIMPPTMRVCQGLILAAEPVLYEPIFLVEIYVPMDQIGVINQVISSRRGRMLTVESTTGPRMQYKGYLPVRESFGFNHVLMEKTGGSVSTSMSLDHYEKLPGSINDKNSILYETVMKIRESKNMTGSLSPEGYFDKL